MIESFSAPAIIETQEYSERVTGEKIPYLRAQMEAALSHLRWLEEQTTTELSKALEPLNIPQLEDLKEKIQIARVEGKETIPLGSAKIPTSSIIEEIIKFRILLLSLEDQEQSLRPAAPSPIILESKNNFDEIEFRAKLTPRTANIASLLPQGVTSKLHPHQEESFQAQITSWTSGMPGILNADEQGLGKTLQTISFLRWLYENADAAPTPSNGPVLIVAPTSLLENWNAEVKIHCDEKGLGTLIPLYGGRISHYKMRGARGAETINGEERLDFSEIRHAISKGEGHRYWILTTYTTLTNYQHSLATLPFSVIVFDAIQALKNPTSLRANAGKVINAAYHIGLTGTPIENTTSELWAIMDQIAPGFMGTLKEFNTDYRDPHPDSMYELYERVFKKQEDRPPLAFRRLKSQAAKALPIKRRLLHPRLMPDVQILSYDNAKSHKMQVARLK